MTATMSLVGLILAAGWATTYVWRFVGVYLAQHTPPDGEILLWVRAVATALVAALVTRLMLAPPGMLGDTSLEARVIAMAAGIACFYASKRQTGTGVAAAAVALFLVTWGLGV